MTPKIPKQPAVRLQRTISARPHRVYRAWLEPDLLRLWLAPGGLEVKRVEIDERAGGHFRVWQTDSGSDAGGFDCELLELVPDKRIVWRWGFVGPDRNNIVYANSIQAGDGPKYDSRLTVTLREAPGGGTVLTLIHERLDDLAAAMPDVAKNVGPGWKLVLEKLSATIGDRDA